MTEGHQRRADDMTFWKRLDTRWKVMASIAGSLVTIGGALWAGIAATSHVAKKALEGTFATKAELEMCAGRLDEMEGQQDEQDERLWNIEWWVSELGKRQGISAPPRRRRGGPIPVRRP